MSVNKILFLSYRILLILFRSFMTILRLFLGFSNILEYQVRKINAVFLIKYNILLVYVNMSFGIF